MPRRIWTGLDAYVEVYHLDSNNNRINLNGTPWVEGDGPLVNYCFFQNMSLTGELPISRRPVTGRKVKRLIAQAVELELTVDHLYLSKDAELSAEQIFHRTKRLELVLRLQASEEASRIDLHTLRPAKRNTFQITGQENGLMSGSAKFLAEELI